MNDQTPIFRVLDASLNRAGEGLRVAEDFARMALDDAYLTRELKSIRHELVKAASSLPWPARLAARDTQEDVGTGISTPSERIRATTWDVCRANLERTQQSLRSLEEYAKLLDIRLAAQFESLRYRLYTLAAALGRVVNSTAQLQNVRLYVLIDGGASEGHFRRLVEELIAAKVDAVQLRDKRLSDCELVGRARLLVDLCRRPADQSEGRLAERPVVIINDRPDVAAASGADGVHLGQDDLPVKDARVILGPTKLIGVSTHSIEQARAAVLAGATYIGVGPVFPSDTKEFAAYAGLAYVRQAAAEIRLPWFAIGGINAGNLAEVVGAGARRIAVSSAVARSASVGGAIATLRNLFVPLH